MVPKFIFLILWIFSITLCDTEGQENQAEIEEIQQVSERIEQLHKRLYLIKHIRNGKIKIPKDLDLEKIEFDDPSFDKFETFEDFKIDKYLTTKGIFESKPGEEIVEFMYLQPPNFWTQNNEMVNPRNQLLVVLQQNKIIKAFSVATLSLVSEIDISSYLKGVQDLKEEIVTFQCSDQNPEEIYILLLTKNGDTNAIRLELKNIETTKKNPTNTTNTANKTKGRREVQSVRVQKTLYASSSISFNVWDTAIHNNQTLYQKDIEERLEQGVIPISLEYSGKGITGNFIIADSQGYFNIYRRAIPEKNEEKENRDLVNLISRTHSGFDTIDIISRYHMLVIYSSESQISFLRTFDGQMMIASCEVGTKKIASIVHDPTVHGRFYVGTQDGDIIVYELLQSKKSLGCSITGKITGDSSENNKIFPLNRFLFQVKQSGEINIFNITQSRVDESTHDWNKMKSVKYKPEQLKDFDFSSLKLKALVTPSSAQLAIFASDEEQGKLILLEILDSEVVIETFLGMIVQSNYFILGISLSSVVIYQFCIKQPRKRPTGQKFNHLDQREPNSKANTKLDDLTKRLGNLDSTAEMLSKIGKDPTIYDSGKVTRRKEKYGNKIDFLQ